MKYNEDVTIKELLNYLENEVYSDNYHYKSGDVEPIDVWKSLGTLETSARDAAIKYLMRYGKKNGKNKKDLFKAIHMILYMIHELEPQQEKSSYVYYGTFTD